MVERRKRHIGEEQERWRVGEEGLGEREKRAINERGRLEGGRRTVRPVGPGVGWGEVMGTWGCGMVKSARGVGGAGHVESQASGPRMGCTVTLFCLFSAWNQTFSEARRN